MEDDIEGRKDDSLKPNLHLMMSDFAEALLEVSKVSDMGAKKYAPRNWRLVKEKYQRYTSAMLRHVLGDSHEGGALDEESGQYHAAHTAWNALARLQIILEREKTR